MLTLPKEITLKFIKAWLPLYVELFVELQEDGARAPMTSRFAKLRHHLGGYVALYDDERKIGIALLMGHLGEEEFRAFNEESRQWSEQENIDFATSLLTEAMDDGITGLEISFPKTDEEWQKEGDALEALPEDEQAKTRREGAFLWAGIFAGLFNFFALMTHGVKMTSLIPLALQGDDDAYLKAVQIDRTLLTHHPYFIERKQRAQDEGDTAFLRALAYRESNPPLRGKVRYPGLFMLFGMLETFWMLDRLRHSEILDFCDEVGLDRFQNRIEDVNYLTKRLGEYRRFQKTHGMSMH